MKIGKYLIVIWGSLFSAPQVQALDNIHNKVLEQSDWPVPTPTLDPGEYNHSTQNSRFNISHCNNQNANVVFDPLPIFDESQHGIYFFHRWANWLHIKTKVKTLENESAFFVTQCDKNKQDLDELERHLRSKKYLRDASVAYHDNDHKIHVKTWDNWSLLPTASLGREGGKNNFSWGVKERNLLGLGIYTRIERFNNAQRSGNRIISTVPLFQKQNLNLHFTIANNDDGKQNSISLDKEFVSFHSNYAYKFAVNDEQRVDTIFQNGEDQSKFSHNIQFQQVQFAWLNKNTGQYATRSSVGFTQDTHHFGLFDELHNNLPSLQVPQNRALHYVWYGFEYIEKDFIKQTNIHLISQIEDFNLGWQINTQIGLGDLTQPNAAWGIFKTNINKGYSFHDTLFLLDFTLSNDVYKHDKDRFYAKLKSEFFYNFADQWVFYLTNVNTLSNNQYIDNPISIGGDGGVRGFPLQYQHGKNAINLTTELRYYPEINLFKVLDLAAATFIDTGKTFGSSYNKNIEDGWLYSTGIGLRLYSPHSSKEHQIIHIDLAFPTSNNPAINRAELRLQLSRYF